MVRRAELDVGGANPAWKGGTGNDEMRKAVQAQVPLRLPCYDFIPVTNQTVMHFTTPQSQRQVNPSVDSFSDRIRVALDALWA